MEVLARNCAEFGIRCYAMGDPGTGIVHVIGPEQGLTQPGMTIVCGDSHTSTHGAFGALAFGIGTSEVEHVLATQTLPQVRPGTMAVTVDGDAAGRGHRQGHRARDHRPHRHRRRDRLGHRVPRLRDPRAVDGRPHDRLQHVDRGRRARRADRARRHDVRVPRGPRRTHRRAPTGSARSTAGARCVTDDDATFDKEVVIDADDAAPARVVGHATRARRSRSTTASPTPIRSPIRRARSSAKRALAYMGLQGRHADPRHRGRHGVHRLVHELAHRGPARRGRRRARPARSSPACARSSCRARPR